MTSQSVPQGGEPDALERLRAARGEGWQWTRIQHEPCPQCRFNPAAMEPASLGTPILDLAAQWRDFLLAAEDTHLRHIPEPGINSPLQYGAHVRDILKLTAERMVVGLEQDHPTVPIFNPRQEVWEAYNRLPPQELAADIEARAHRVAEIVEHVKPADWSRVVINDRGQYGVYSFTIAGLARNAVHEAYHHLLDAKGTLFFDTSNEPTTLP